MINILTSHATEEQVAEMLEEYDDYIKLPVDIRLGIAAGGGEYHSDCEGILIGQGSKQEDIWGSGWVPSTKEIRFEAMINLQPLRKNPSMKILDKSVRERIAEIINNIFAKV